MHLLRRPPAELPTTDLPQTRRHRNRWSPIIVNRSQVLDTIGRSSERVRTAAATPPRHTKPHHETQEGETTDHKGKNEDKAVRRKTCNPFTSKSTHTLGGAGRSIRPFPSVQMPYDYTRRSPREVLPCPLDLSASGLWRNGQYYGDRSDSKYIFKVLTQKALGRPGVLANSSLVPVRAVVLVALRDYRVRTSQYRLLCRFPKWLIYTTTVPQHLVSKFPGTPVPDPGMILAATRSPLPPVRSVEMTYCATQQSVPVPDMSYL